MTSGQLDPPPGVYSWQATAADLGIDLDTAVKVGSFGELDAYCRAHRLEGGTYATGVPGFAARMAYVVHGGRQYVAPARWDAMACSWPNPGQRPYERGRMEADHAEDLATRRYMDRGVIDQ